MKNLLPCVLLCLVCISLSIRAGAQEINYQHVVVDAEYPKRVHCKTVGDINGDGYPDLAGANHGNHGVPTAVEIWLSQPK
jgi:hypothetical protein